MAGFIDRALFKLGTFLGRLSEIKFNIHLNFLSWRYGGGANIPHDKLPQLLPEDPKASSDVAAAIKAAIIIEKLCDRFSLDMFETKFGKHYGRLIGNQVDGPDDYRDIVEILRRPNLRRAIFDALVSYGDIDQRKLDYFLAGTKKEEFENWLDNKEK